MPGAIKGFKNCTRLIFKILNLSGKITLYSWKISPANHKLFDKNFGVARKTYKVNPIGKRP